MSHGTIAAAEAASYLSISKDQLYRLARSGALPHTRVGRKFRFRMEDIAAYRSQHPPRVNHALSSSQELFVKVFDATPHAISISTLSEGRLLDVNESLLRLTGYSREEIVGRTTVEINIYSNIEDRARIRQILLERGAITDLEINFRIKSGEVLLGLLSAEVLEFAGEKCVLATVTDITERSRAEAALRESEDRFRTVAETASDAIIMIDEQSTIVFINPAAESIFGYAVEEMRGKQLTMLMPDYLRHIHRQSLNRYVETGKKHISWRAVELPGLRKDGREIPLELSFGDFIREGRHFFTGIARDISKRKQLETALRLRAEELAEANRLKDEFLATLSHELRTPLTSILGWAHLLQTGNLDEGVTTRGIEAIQRNAKSQAQLIEDLLDVSRVISGKMHLEVQPINLANVIEAAIDGLRPAADAKGVELMATLDRSLIVNGDADRLQQVIWNLLSNSIKFTAAKGKIELQLVRALDADEAQIIVKDTGIGISPDFLPRVFDRFRQADSTSTRSYGGLGLGLALVRHMVEMHGGHVRADSAGLGLGTTFTVQLPLIAGAGSTGRRTPALRVTDHPSIGDCDEQELKGLRVLIVDDEEDARDLVRTVLMQCGAETLTASSAVEALSVIEKERPDLLVCDIGMPGEDGYALIGRVRALAAERGGGVPAVALTAYAREEDRRRALDAGFQVHVSKPIEPSELVQVVARLAGRVRPI
ncbi:MAG TPA: PAS domain S-box protein [Pyrinomonadaceae bacterium]|nr:PAS domain S-box protein [Pyrinomonadaceae bacterium]